MESNQDSLFTKAMARYEAGVAPTELIKDFEEITTAIPNQSAGWTCLAWLQLLCNDSSAALRSARVAVKLNGQDPQARINLCLALLETNSKGVRVQIDFVKNILGALPELKKELQDSINDGLTKKPDWGALQKVKSWLGL